MGLASWEKIIESFGSLPAILNASFEDIVAVPGFAEKTSEQVVLGLRSRAKLIEVLLAAGIKPTTPLLGEGPLKDMTFVITGALSRPREEIEQFIKTHGGKVSSSVSAKTTALITNETDSTSSKMKKAASLNIPIWNEDKLYEFVK
jgi:DNA ligase (NAD+)